MVDVELAQRARDSELDRILERLSRSIVSSHSVDPTLASYRKPRVKLVLGTDCAIGGALSPEQRVGINPSQVGHLRRFFADLHVELAVHVVQNAGRLAGWSDADYIAAGATIIHADAISAEDAPDVVHALKEPSLYEGGFMGPFMRIGALHGGDFRVDGGLASLLARGDVALFDGSATGAPGRFRIPIRGRMSVFAGEIAAEWVIDHLGADKRSHRIVIVGGGNVGTSCAKKLLAGGCGDILICEAASTPERLATVAANVSKTGGAQVVPIDGLDDPRLLSALEGAMAVVFAVFMHGHRTPRVVSVGALRTQLAPGAIIVDVSIDERGAIQDEGANNDWSSEELIPWLTQRLLPLRYQAIPNMPRAYPRAASTAHGEVILPYLATLLYLAAKHGGPEGALSRLRQIPVDLYGDDPLLVDEGEMFSALGQDLRNGLAVCPTPTGLEIADIVPEADRLAIRALLNAKVSNIDASG